MQIEKLRQYKTSDDGYYWIQHPTGDDIVDKINEIIDYINSSENLRTPFEYDYAFLNNNFGNEACENCSANPKNGGDGICFCILGQREWRC